MRLTVRAMDRPLRDASFGWLAVRLREVYAERERLPDTLPCVEPEGARDDLRDTIEQDYRQLVEELAVRRALVEAMSVDAYDDGCTLLLFPPG